MSDEQQDAYVLACEYVRWRLSMREQFDWSTCPELPIPNRVCLVLRQLGDQLEECYAEELIEMAEHLGPIKLDTAYPTFMQVAEGLFADGINHGRVVALFAFGGVLAGRVCRQTPHLVGTVTDWIATFYESRLDTWMQANGGWRKMMQLQERPQWSNKKMVILGIIATVSAFTLGQIMST